MILFLCPTHIHTSFPTNLPSLVQISKAGKIISQKKTMIWDNLAEFLYTEMMQKTQRNDDRNRKRKLERPNYLIYVVIVPGNVCARLVRTCTRGCNNSFSCTFLLMMIRICSTSSRCRYHDVHCILSRKTLNYDKYAIAF